MESSNPVFEKDGLWYFWDETWSDALGPYQSEFAARMACKEYAENL
jgi:hypothetical protein